MKVTQEFSDDESEEMTLSQDPTGPPGQLYQGQLEDQMKHGAGVLHYDFGNVRLVYKGDFVHNKKHGRGVLTWTQNMYEGQFANGEFHGQGCMTWANGNQYVGEYVNGNKHGVGTCLFPDGSKYSGQFCKGFEAFWKPLPSEAYIYTHQLHQGKRHGTIKYVKANSAEKIS